MDRQFLPNHRWFHYDKDFLNLQIYILFLLFYFILVCIGMYIPWQTALAAVLVSGIVFLVISATGLRELIIKSIPDNMKYATSACIGLFIAFIGFKNVGIIVSSESTYVALGNLKDKGALVSIIWLSIKAILMVRGVKTAIFCGLLACIGFWVLFGVINFPSAIVSMPPSVAPTFGVAISNLKLVFTPQMLFVVFTFLFMDFFDTAGTILAVGSKVGLLKSDGSIENGSKALLADSAATCIGAILGTTNTTSCMESLSGIAAGAKTGIV